jgi:hypothetical protein
MSSKNLAHRSRARPQGLDAERPQLRAGRAEPPVRRGDQTRRAPHAATGRNQPRGRRCTYLRFRTAAGAVCAAQARRDHSVCRTQARVARIGASRLTRSETGPCGTDGKCDPGVGAQLHKVGVREIGVILNPLRVKDPQARSRPVCTLGFIPYKPELQGARS